MDSLVDLADEIPPEPDTVGEAVRAAYGLAEIADIDEWLGESPTETRSNIDF